MSVEAFREIFWGITFGPHILYPLGVISLGILIYALYRRCRLWAVGRPDRRWDNLGKRIWNFIVSGVIDLLFHRRFLREPYPGIMHFLLFMGAGILLVGTVLDVIDHYVIHFLQGNVYLVFSLVLDIGGILMLVGATMAVIRRYIQKPERLNTVFDNAVALGLIYIVVITGFFIEGFRMIAAVPEGLSQPEFYSHPEWSRWSFGGYFIASLFAHLPESTRLAWYVGLWWFHAAVALGAIFYVCLSFGKLTHIIVSPINAFFRSFGSKVALAPINTRKAETFGVGRIENFTWKQLLDLDACTDCGRCQDRCPAYLTGKPLSPRKVIQDLRTHLLDKSSALLSAKAATPADSNTVKTLTGEVILEEELWACTSCLACQEICPVFVEHVAKVIDMRRYLVQMQAKFPDELLSFFENMEQRSNPWGIAPGDRAKWASELDVKHFEAGIEYLLYVGCYGAFDARSRRVSVALANILNRAGVSWGILGKDELCCGDSLRRLGNEYVFDQMVKANMKLFSDKGIQKIITQCPHCFSTLKHDYRQYGLELEVVHHTEFIEQLLRDNRLKLNGAVDLGNTVFHDSCYLGRYNQIYQAPRQVISAVTGHKPLEMKRHRENSFCCGAGGGRMWLEESTPKKIYQARTEEALEHNPSVVCVCCPYCMTMFEDGLKEKGTLGKVNVLDLAEIVEKALK